MIDDNIGKSRVSVEICFDDETNEKIPRIERGKINGQSIWCYLRIGYENGRRALIFNLKTFKIVFVNLL